MVVTISEGKLTALRSAFGDRLQENAPLDRYTAARLGGKADILITVGSAAELVAVAKLCSEQDIPFTILGSGSNVLISDRGVRQLVVLNHARKVIFNLQASPLSVWAESGANFGALARKAATRGFSGLEWAAGIPGTVGGAVYGNAGAHNNDMNSTLLVANILQLKPTKNGFHQSFLQEDMPVEQLGYSYRSSSLKRQPGRSLVVSATLKLTQSSPETVRAKMDAYRITRRSSQPSGASLGSIFKNPPGDFAGRLVEDAGLKGRKIGNVEVSKVHANFFINLGNANADDYAKLIRLVQQEVFEKFGVSLEPEIELIGDWVETEG